MAEQHTIISRHVGKIGVLVKGENVEVEFEEKDGKGVAKVDAAVRDALLKVPGYTKPQSKASTKKVVAGSEDSGAGSEGDAGSEDLGEGNGVDGDTGEGEGSEEEKSSEEDGDSGNADDVLSKERYAAIKNLNELKGLLPGCNSQELLMQLIAEETESSTTRTTYTKEMQDRLDELQAAQ